MKRRMLGALVSIAIGALGFGGFLFGHSIDLRSESSWTAYRAEFEDGSVSHSPIPRWVVFDCDCGIQFEPDVPLDTSQVNDMRAGW